MGEYSLWCGVAGRGKLREKRNSAGPENLPFSWTGEVMIETDDGERGMIEEVMGYPRVGISVIVTRGSGEVIMGKRKGSHGADTWAFPGGHLEYGETWLGCAVRELEEETGVVPVKVEFSGQVTNDFFLVERLHYITIYMLATTRDEPQLMEPEKCEQWRWFHWNNLPPHDRLFLPIKNLLRTGYRPPL